MTSPGTARRLWALGEPFHALTYFATEARTAAEEAGVRGFWSAYFAMRAAPLGPVGPEVVTATFVGFAPPFVRRWVPAVWEAVSPEEALTARQAGIDAAVRRVLGEEWPDSAEAAEAASLAATAAAAVDAPGRPWWGGPGARRRPRCPRCACRRGCAARRGRCSSPGRRSRRRSARPG